MTWIRIFKFLAWWREREQNERFLAASSIQEDSITPDAIDGNRGNIQQRITQICSRKTGVLYVDRSLELLGFDLNCF